MFPTSIRTMLADFMHSSQNLTVLTGAGISAESGIPTFRGPEGFWTVGSQEYRPQEMATKHTFLKQPYEVWKWYLYRMGICIQANPNPGHLALAKIEKLLGTRFRLITQNVDNLHLKAGNSLDRTYQIHGNIFYARCLRDCDQQIHPLPADLKPKEKGDTLSAAEKALLICPSCGELLRPHVLWFDESYNEHYYFFESALETASQTDLLLTVGTSGATNLPNQVAWQVFQKGGTLIDINPERNPFAELAEKSPQGVFLQGTSASLLTGILEAITTTPAN